MTQQRTARMPRHDRKKNKKPTVAYLHVKFHDNPSLKAFGISDYQKGLNTVERNILKKNKGKWKYAYLKQKDTPNVFYYYHPATGTERLDKDKYNKQAKLYSIYIVPTTAYKRKYNTQKGTSKLIKGLDQVAQHYNKDVLKILIYENGKHINTFENGKFLK